MKRSYISAMTPATTRKKHERRSQHRIIRPRVTVTFIVQNIEIVLDEQSSANDWILIEVDRAYV